ncbi:MAG: hypothetical protein D6675_12330, partial [Gemmatimonadetes bacterium]
ICRDVALQRLYGGILPNPDKRAGFPHGLEALARFFRMVMGDIRRDVAVQRLYGGILPNPDKRAGFPHGLEALAKFLGMVMGDKKITGVLTTCNSSRRT